MATLIDQGFLDQLLISHDVCTKAQLRSYGGGGYTHITRMIEPALEEAGLTIKEITSLRVDNPARALA